MSLRPGVDCFTLLELLQKAAQFKGLVLSPECSDAFSEAIKTYDLDDMLLRVLDGQGIRQQARPDCNGEIFTLVDYNPQEPQPGYAASNYWNFKRSEDGRSYGLRISLAAGFGLSKFSRGITLYPRTFGTFLSAGDPLPNFRMFKALAYSDPDAPAIARELAASSGSLTVSWTELGVGGIRRISALFEEFPGNNEAVLQLGRRGQVFDPKPYPQYAQPGDKLYVAETAQPLLFETWRAQLEEYRRSLAT